MHCVLQKIVIYYYYRYRQPPYQHKFVSVAHNIRTYTYTLNPPYCDSLKLSQKTKSVLRV